MAYPTLEELKHFEIGSKGNFLVRFEDKTLNTLKSGVGYIPATNVTYSYLKTDYYDMSINRTSVPMFYDIKYPTSVNIEVFEDYKDTLFRGLIGWIKETSVFKTGRLPKDLMKDAKRLEVFEYGKGDDGVLKIINRDTFKVNPPMEFAKSFSQEVGAKSYSFEFNIVGGVNFDPR
jgi:hypothetical protein